MSKRTLFKLVIVLAALSVLLSTASAFAGYAGSAGFAKQPVPSAAERLQQAAVGEVEFTWNPATATPSFLRGQVPTAALPGSDPASSARTALAFLDAYADLFAMQNPANELLLVQETTDKLGIQHAWFRQVYAGVPVYGAEVKIHLRAGSQDVLAVSNGFIPAIRLPDTRAQVTSDQAALAALQALPRGEITKAPELVVYAPSGSAGGAESARLVWMVEARDDSIPARSLYAVDATLGRVVDVIDRLYVGRNRRTYDAGHGTSLPGTLARSEGSPPVNDQDVDNAHDFAGATYDYFWGAFSLDSYDGQGADLISTAHYGSGYQNAFWNGTQMVYGDNFPVKDVAAHELTHAVTEHSANLQYRWQSGALNESFSDIFGAMVDRDDWLMGEDLPIGAIRDLEDPTRYGQPAHTSNWVATCSDNEGVHTNSGITNKAFYIIATATSKNIAEQVFYRALSVYLTTTSSLEAARAAALQSAQDLYGAGSAEYNAVAAGFNAVGLDGTWNPPTNSCTCAVSAVLSGAENVGGMGIADGRDIAATLYRVRDELLTANSDVLRYRELYERHTGRITFLVLLSPSLRAGATQILIDVTPGLGLLLDGQGQSAVVSQETVNAVTAFLGELAAQDRAKGGGTLARVIEQEMARFDWPGLSEMTYEQAWVYIQARLASSSLFMPVLAR